MCTVVIEVPADLTAPTRVLAVRDEDPARPWDPPSEWWPDSYPGTVGVRDRRANGAWLAARQEASLQEGGRLSVVVNRAGELIEPPGGFTSRGGLVLASVNGDELTDPPTAAPFSLVEVVGSSAFVSAWDGVELRRDALAPGLHMLAHHDVDDPRSARIARWLPEFQALAGAPDSEWRGLWVNLLGRTAELAPTDDEAIVRDNRPLGYPTLSLLTCVAEVRPVLDAAGAGGGADGVDLRWAPFPDPGLWVTPEFTRV
ncbi:MAG: NRDE family protein [Leucobacter sp.]